MNDPSRTNARNGTPQRDPFHDFPLADADACVKCGLCLPHCPTYTLTRHEADSPRGRIALLQGLAEQALEPRGNALAHLDGCLTCRACERVCPADVQYGRLIDAGRLGLWRSGHRPGWVWRVLAFLRRTPRRISLMSSLLRILALTRASSLLAGLPLGSISRVNQFITKAGTPPASGIHLPTGTPRGRVGLFLGCIARPLDAAVAHAAVRVLNAMAYEVEIPATQGCCGAMDAHAGDASTATALKRANAEAFSGNLDAIVTTASGCGVELQEYLQAGDCSTVASDIMQFIRGNQDRLPALLPQKRHVIVHTPCTLKNGMRDKDSAVSVLRLIPGLNVTPLQHEHCCGAAGSYLFEHPATADELGNALLDAVDGEPDILATSNIGCSLHVNRLARLRGMHMALRHPVELLAASLPGD